MNVCLYHVIYEVYVDVQYINGCTSPVPMRDLTYKCTMQNEGNAIALKAFRIDGTL